MIDVTNTSRNLIRVTPQFCQSNISTSRPVRWTGSSGVPPPNVSPGELDQHIFGLHLVKTLDGDIQQIKLRFYRGLVDQTQYQFWWMNLGSTREIFIPANYPENWSCGIFLKWGQLFLRLCRWLVKVDTKLWGYLRNFGEYTERDFSFLTTAELSHWGRSLAQNMSAKTFQFKPLVFSSRWWPVDHGSGGPAHTNSFNLV